MAKYKIAIGPAGLRVATNVRRLRRDRDWTLAKLSDELAAVGRPLSQLTLSQIETGQRRVDADDLFAFMGVLDASADELLTGEPPVAPTVVEYDAATHAAYAQLLELTHEERLKIISDTDGERLASMSPLERRFRDLELEMLQLRADLGREGA